MSATTFADHLSGIASRYRGFIIDQWGVLHDGGEPYPDANDCLKALRAEGARIVLLSNSGKRSAHNQKLLSKMGYGEELFDAIVTSGEACWRALKDRDSEAFAGLGRRCFLWSRGGDEAHVDGLDIEVVARAEDADFLYLAGVPDHAEIETYLGALEIGARRDLPLLCANPDIIAIYPNGGRGMAPGGVARRYEVLGGKALYVGKPHRPVYELCLKELGDLPRDALLGIGDSLEHDVAGGNGIGIDTLLLTHGVHRDAFAGAEDDEAMRKALDPLAETYGARPRWVLPRFQW